MLKSYNEMRQVDVSKYVEKRDGVEYLNWAKVVDLLHENGAEKVYFEPIANESGSSLYMTNIEFKDSRGVTNRVYETAIRIVIDDMEFIQRGPVTNGANPVKDNSMTQQRLWNCQTRLFVKGVAIRTGLGFNLWLKEENKYLTIEEENLDKHRIEAIQERCQIKYTKLLKQGMTVSEIAKELHKTVDEVKLLFSFFDTLKNFEEDLEKLAIKK